MTDDRKTGEDGDVEPTEGSVANVGGAGAEDETEPGDGAHGDGDSPTDERPEDGTNGSQAGEEREPREEAVDKDGRASDGSGERTKAEEGDQDAGGDRTSSRSAEEDRSTEDSSDSTGGRADDSENEWAVKVRRAWALWEAGNKAELRTLLDELEAAPEDEREARETAAELRARLRPDPIAIGLWLVTLAVFCFLSYWFILR